MEDITRTAEVTETANENEYRGKFKVGKLENIRFNMFMTRKNIVISIVLLFTVVLGIRIYQQMTTGGMTLFPAIVSSLPMALVCAVLIPALQASSSALSILIVYRQGKAKPFTQELVLNDEGLFATAAPGTSKVVWKNLAFVRETPFDFLMFYSAKGAFILPKNQMRDKTAESEKVRRILRMHLKEDRLKLRG